MLHACPPESLNIFEEAFEKFKKDRDAAGAFLSLSGMFESIGHMFDSFIGYGRDSHDECASGRIPSVSLTANRGKSC